MSEPSGNALHLRVRRELEALAEPSYRDFSLSLTPGAGEMLGVRLPRLRNMARELARTGWREYVAGLSSISLFEEKMLAGMALGVARGVAWEERLGWIAHFVPFIDNWAVCDAFCQSLAFVKKELKRFRPVLDEYAASEAVYAARFALVAALKYYALPPWTETTLAMASSVSNRIDAYYVRMAAAWAVAECAAKNPAAAMAFLQRGTLDAWTHNKALQKMRESFRIDAATKAALRTLRR